MQAISQVLQDILKDADGLPGLHSAQQDTLQLNTSNHLIGYSRCAAEKYGSSCTLGRLNAPGQCVVPINIARLRARSIYLTLYDRLLESDLPDDPDPRTVFVKLRELRNSW